MCFVAKCLGSVRKDVILTVTNVTLTEYPAVSRGGSEINRKLKEFREEMVGLGCEIE